MFKEMKYESFALILLLSLINCYAIGQTSINNFPGSLAESDFGVQHWSVVNDDSIALWLAHWVKDVDTQLYYAYAVADTKMEN